MHRGTAYADGSRRAVVVISHICWKGLLLSRKKLLGEGDEDALEAAQRAMQEATGARRPRVKKGAVNKEPAVASAARGTLDP